MENGTVQSHDQSAIHCCYILQQLQNKWIWSPHLQQICWICVLGVVSRVLVIWLLQSARNSAAHYSFGLQGRQGTLNDLQGRCEASWRTAIMTDDQTTLCPVKMPEILDEHPCHEGKGVWTDWGQQTSIEWQVTWNDARSIHLEAPRSGIGVSQKQPHDCKRRE